MTTRWKEQGNSKSPKVLAFSWQEIWVIACQLLVTTAKDQDCCVPIAGNGHLLFMNFGLSRRLCREGTQVSRKEDLANTLSGHYCLMQRSHKRVSREATMKISLEKILIFQWQYIFKSTDGYTLWKTNNKVTLIIIYSNRRTFTNQ